MYLRDSAADSAFPPPACFEGQPYIDDRFVQEDAAIEWLRADVAG